MEDDVSRSVTPMTALVVDDQGRLTYIGTDGCRRVIVGNPDVLRRLRDLRRKPMDDFDGGCGI